MKASALIVLVVCSYRVGCGWGDGAAPSSARCEDGVDGGSVDAGVRVRPIASLRDAFDDGGIDLNVWSVLPAGCGATVTVANAEFEVFTPAVPSALPCYAGLYSVQAWSLRGSSVTVELGALGTSESGYQTFIHVGTGDDFVSLNFQDDALYEDLSVDGGRVWTKLISVPQGSVRSMRISANATELWVDVSDAGAQWSQVLLRPHPFALDAVHLSLGAGRFLKGAQNATSHFDGVNVP